VIRNSKPTPQAYKRQQRQLLRKYMSAFISYSKKQSKVTCISEMYSECQRDLNKNSNHRTETLSICCISISPDFTAMETLDKKCKV